MGAGGTAATGGAIGTGGVGGASVLDASSADSSVGLPCQGRDPGPPLPCQGISVSTLPGVSTRLIPSRCTFTSQEALAGVDVPFEVVVAGRGVHIVPAPLDAGGCDRPDASGLIPFVDVSGGGQHYCICDTGLCAPPPQVPVELSPGCYAATAHWEGVNWFGPSDTGNPKGTSFPPGTYLVAVRQGGTLVLEGGSQSFQIDAAITVTITP